MGEATALPQFRAWLGPDGKPVPGAYAVFDTTGFCRGRVTRAPQGWQAMVSRRDGDLEALGLSRTRVLAGALVLLTWRGRSRNRRPRTD